MALLVVQGSGYVIGGTAVWLLTRRLLRAPALASD
jgi:hypothetical protein